MRPFRGCIISVVDIERKKNRSGSTLLPPLPNFLRRVQIDSKRCVRGREGEVRIFITDFSTRKPTLRMLNLNSFKDYFFGQIRLMREDQRGGRMKGGGEREMALLF